MKFPKKEDLVEKYNRKQEKIQDSFHAEIHVTMKERDFVPDKPMVFTVPKELSSEKLNELIESCIDSGWTADLTQAVDDLDILELSIR